jgi:hypothetical protein
MCGNYAVIEGGQHTACVGALMTAFIPQSSTYGYNEYLVTVLYLAQDPACPRRN